MTSGRCGARVAAVVLLLSALAACGTGESIDQLAPPERPGQPAGTVVVTSTAPLAATVERLRGAITAGGGTVAAVVDHAADARAAGVSIAPNTVVIGGSPAAAAPLLRIGQGAAATLPGRYLVRQGSGGGTTVTWNSADYVAAVSAIGTTGASDALAREVATVGSRGAGVRVAPSAAPLVGITPDRYFLRLDGVSSFATTVERLRSNAGIGGSSVVDVLDLAAGTDRTGPAVRATTEILVSTPAAEAPLIAAKPSFGLEMPVRYVVWLDDRAVTHVGYPDVRKLAARHGISTVDPDVARLARDADQLARVAAGTAGGERVIVTGYDDRTGTGYVLSTGADAAAATPVSHAGVTVQATPELAAALRDALAHRPTALLSWSGPEVPLTLDDATVLAWLRHTIGGVLTVRGGPDR